MRTLLDFETLPETVRACQELIDSLNRQDVDLQRAIILSRLTIDESRDAMRRSFFELSSPVAGPSTGTSRANGIVRKQV